MSSYSDLNMKTLKEICRDRGVKYISQMNKAQLVDVLKKNDEDPSFVCDPDAKKKCFAAYDRWRENHRETYLEWHKKYSRERRALNKAGLI